jgi:hypothetical protein
MADRILRSLAVTHVVRGAARTRIIAGSRGLRGQPGSGGAAVSYTHTQASPLAQWTVNHNLGARVLVAVFSPGGVEVEADIVHVSTNQCLINFASPQSGSARCV